MISYILADIVRRQNCGDKEENRSSCLSTLPEVKADMTQFKNALAIVFAAIAAVAIIAVVLAAISYATSEGNPDNISKAKKTIIYALLGLVISLSAEALVFTVLGKL